MTPILEVRPLGFPWTTFDPFLFCVHHDDAYPEGNEQMGPNVSLAGRDLGQDFELRDGFRMYHGHVVPGFPQHPHRGFETVTLARKGLIDHSDSLGAVARFGGGDVQWMTAGRGVVHAEMFPLLDRERSNPVELFQIWLNLPREHKMVEPHFKMLWSSTIPKHRVVDGAGRASLVTLVAGDLGGSVAPSPPPHSWASQPQAQVVIWPIQMEADAELTLPAFASGTNRTLYFFAGDALEVAGEVFERHCLLRTRPDAPLTLRAAGSAVEVLVLAGRPIAEPVVQYGPFVMNTRAEIQQAIADYQRTRFGGWPWPVDDPVHPRDQARFARHPDGRIERGDGDSA